MSSVNDSDNIDHQLTTTSHLDQNSMQKEFKMKECHACPEFKLSDCTIFNQQMRCVKPKVWYYHDGYCMRAEFACNNSFHAVQGRLIDTNDGYASINEDDKKHIKYGVYQLNRLDENNQRFPIRGTKHSPRENLFCMADKRWYYRFDRLPIIIRTDQIFCI